MFQKLLMILARYILGKLVKNNAPPPPSAHQITELNFFFLYCHRTQKGWFVILNWIGSSHPNCIMKALHLKNMSLACTDIEKAEIKLVVMEADGMWVCTVQFCTDAKIATSSKRHL